MGNIQKKLIIATAFFFLIWLLVPSSALAATDLKVSGWIPYWRTSEGTKDAKSNLSKLDTIHPFGYTVKSDGTLEDLAKLNSSAWKKLFRSARSDDVEVIPTVMSGNGAYIHTILGDAKLREKHINEIVKMVRKGSFDGVDIDYEAKFVSTRDNFSLFLKELKEELGSKILSCTIEARTPPDSVPNPQTESGYANDHRAIGTYCDRVQIMAYDQGRIDVKLNLENLGKPYVPVSDVKWARKTIEQTMLSIPKEKIMLGVPTYGYEYLVTVTPKWFKEYGRLWAFNPKYGVDTAKKYKITPLRDKGGEMSFSYVPNDSKFGFLSSLTAQNIKLSGNDIAEAALMWANATGQPVLFNLAVWSDAEAIKQKIELAKELGIRGVAIFKIDGGEDMGMWKMINDQ